jgi:hypothetical protein
MDELQLAGCPECAATAEVVRVATASTTHGPVDVVHVVCVNRHWFLMAADALDTR